MPLAYRASRCRSGRWASAIRLASAVRWRSPRPCRSTRPEPAGPLRLVFDFAPLSSSAVDPSLATPGRRSSVRFPQPARSRHAGFQAQTPAAATGRSSVLRPVHRTSGEHEHEHDQKGERRGSEREPRPQRRARGFLGELGQDALAQIRARLDAHHLAHRAIDRRIEMRIGAEMRIAELFIRHTHAPGPPSFPSTRGALPTRATSPCPPARRG